MKIIAALDNDKYLVEMSNEELANLSGFINHYHFDKGYNVESNRAVNHVDYWKALKDKIIPISDIYKSATETLATYSELKTKFESIRNQLSSLLGKMEVLKPEERKVV
jgi:hypothetical protein